ncbi:MAG: hypothetical protein RLZ12_1015 [Bacillota bacterium]|jgi:hypothetical protein
MIKFHTFSLKSSFAFWFFFCYNTRLADGRVLVAARRVLVAARYDKRALFSGAVAIMKLLPRLATWAAINMTAARPIGRKIWGILSPLYFRGEWAIRQPETTRVSA